jgi:hypothetical protein
MLQQLSDKELLSTIKTLATKEKELTLLVIEHLEEIGRRRLFADLGFSSLFAYCTKHLGYSDSEAYYRINDMKLTASIPKAKEKIKTGELSLTNASQVYSTIKKIEKFEHEEKTKEKIKDQAITLPEKFEKSEKLSVELSEKLITEVIGKSKREAEFILNGYSEKPEAKKIKMEVSIEAYQNFEQYRKDHGSFSDEEIIHLLFKQLNEKNSEKIPLKKASNKMTLPKNSRYISISIKEKLKKRSGNCCEYISPITGLRCSEKRGLEFDHIQPFAKGGTNDIRNLRLICRPHNQRFAIQEFGLKKMEHFYHKL